jgi:EAL domain-containing protein (putative c-di-GMP-specific phosphodiesterase class I)
MDVRPQGAGPGEAMMGAPGCAIWLSEEVEGFRPGWREGGAPVYVFEGADWPAQALLFVESLSEAQLLAGRAVDLDPEEPLDLWHAEPLMELAGRLASPWLGPLLRQGLQAHLQPVYSLSEDRLFGYESLARGMWGGKLLNGFQLVQAAQAHGRLAEFDQAALAAAMDTAHSLPSHARLLVNVVPACLAAQPDWMDRVLGMIDDRGLEPDQFIFEFVEFEEHPDTEALREAAAALREMGAGVALDDLGSGHTAVRLIDELLPDLVKLDRSLMRLLREGPGQDLLASVAAYAHASGAQLVAEGVETRDDLMRVRDAGIELVQGWMIGRPAPVPADEQAVRASII